MEHRPEMNFALWRSKNVLRASVYTHSIKFISATFSKYSFFVLPRCKKIEYFHVLINFRETFQGRLNNLLKWLDTSPGKLFLNMYYKIYYCCNFFLSYFTKLCKILKSYLLHILAVLLKRPMDVLNVTKRRQ